MNRICELEKNSLLIINGEQGNFYRVKLTDSRNGWIKKDAVTKLDYEDEQFFGYFKESKTVDDGEKIIYKATFNRTLPYEVKTTETKIILNVYNVEGCSDLTSTVVFKKPDITTYSTQFVNGQLTLKINKHPNLIGTNSLRGVNIVIDAGHGGEENGTIGCLGTKEKDINFKQAKILKEILKNNGANVFLTREYDLTLSLKDRVKFAKENEAVIFVSLHFNAVPSGADPIKNKGTTVYYYNMASKNLAQAVQNNMVKTVFTKDNGIKRASFAVIRPTDYVGILVETAFLINPEDSLLYMQPKFLEETALAISQGIQDFITGTGDNYCTFKPISHKKKRCLKRK